MIKLMKKIIIILIAVLLFSPCAFAKTGGPIECVGKGKFALSLDTEYIAEQRMHQDEINLLDSVGGRYGENNIVFHNIDMRIDRHYLKLRYGLFDALDIFFSVGAQREKLEADAFIIGGPNLPHRFVGDYNPLIGGGFNARLFPVGKLFDVGFSSHYLWAKGKLKLQNIYLGNEHVNILTSETEYYSWDAALYFYRQFKYATPYIGAKYQNSKYSIKADFNNVAPAGATQNVDPYSYDQDMPWILFWGCDFHINDRLDANIELSTFGSRSASFGLTWKF